ncbi:DUF192 domain-containing protein [archaeon]|nr:DUF192 domain-containing protein [archaeon]MBL7056859.1 DUF192 domain-containing protein [Candidatus Woesearchaeota archaeon]
MDKRIIILGLFVLLTACSTQETTNYEHRDVIINDINIDVEIADSFSVQMQGLMYREELGEYSGMLFIFPDEIERTFWMKNTLIPLDMIFIDSNMKIVKIVQAKPCIKDPCEHYPSERAAMYVLEVNKGFSESHGIKEGNIVLIR